MGRSRRRRRRWLAVTVLAVLLVIGSAFAYVRVEWEGSDLGDNIASILNKRMRGRISIGSVEWDVGSLKTVARGGWAPVRIYNVKVWDDCALSSELDPLDERRQGDPNEDCTLDDRPDPDPSSKRKPRKLLADIPKLTGEIDVHAALFGTHDLYFRNVHVWGGELLLEETREPYPLHAYDRTIVSILTAFYPRMKAGFRAGIYADKPPPKFELHDIHIHGINLTLQFAPSANADGTVSYGLAARIENVDVDAKPEAGAQPTSYLHMNATDPLVPKFYVRLAISGKRTKIRVLDVGKREAFVIRGRGLNEQWADGRKALYELELSEIVVNRLAQMPDQWAKKDYVANNLELDLFAKTVPCGTPAGTKPDPALGAELRLTGQLLEWWDRPYDGKWDLQLAVKNLGPTLRTCIKSTLGGDNLNGTIKLSGPFVAKPKVTLDLEGLDFDVPLSKTEEPVRLTLAEVHGEIDLVNEHGSLDRTKALIRGGKEPGEVMVGATFQLKPWRVKASIDITKSIDIGRFLPPKTVTAVGKFLQGKLTAEGDSELGFELKEFDLALGRTDSPKDKSIRVHKGRLFTDNDFEEIHIQKVAVDAGRSHAVFEGWVNTIKEHDNINLRVQGCFPDFGVWLERFGLPRFAESACGTAQTPPPGSAALVPSMLQLVRAQAGGGGGGNNSGSTVTITGNYKAPTVALQTTLGGVPCMDNLRLNATFSADTGIATIHSISSTGLGGSFNGSGRLSFPQGGLPRIEKLHLEGRKLDSSKLCGLAGTLKGTLEVLDVDVKPTTIVKTREALDWMQYFQLYVSAKKVTFKGENYTNATACINRSDDNRCRPAWGANRLAPTALASCDEAKQKGGSCIVASADRALGGRFAATVADVPPTKQGRVSINRRLAGTIALDDLPLAVLDPWIGKGSIGGLVSATVHLGGDRQAPSVDIGSTVNLTRAWLAGAYLGDAQLGIYPATYRNVHAVRFYGLAMASRLVIDANVGTAAPYPIEFALHGRRLEIDQFVDLTAKLGLPETLQAWASGSVTLLTELAPIGGKPAKPEVWVELTEAEANVNHRANDGRRMPIRLSFKPRDRNSAALSARITSDTIELACRAYNIASGRQPCPAYLETPAGVVKISGTATAASMNLEAYSWEMPTTKDPRDSGRKGTLDLRRLAPLLENQLEGVAGKLELEAHVRGTFKAPSYEVSLDVAKDCPTCATGAASIRLPGTESVIQVLGPRKVDGEDQPGAQIKIANGTLGLSSFTINVKDERKDEQGELIVSGGVELAGLSPKKWGLKIEGKLAGKMLSALVPGALTQASGLARIDANLRGEGRLPLVDAQINFDPEEGQRQQPLTITPRGVRRELAILAGVVDITTQQTGDRRTYTIAHANPLDISIDSEGKVQNVRGKIVLEDDKLDFADLALSAENIPYRVPGKFDLILSATNVRLVLPRADSAWQARGNIALVNGVYKQRFDLADTIRPAPVTTTPAKPFWDEYPSIGDASLDVAIDVRKFAIENNLANIDLDGDLILTGSPRDPRLSGTITVRRGEFKLTGTRARFTRTVGTIDFTENEKASNPSFNITSDAPEYTDLSGTKHTITFSLFGTLNQLQWDLRTSTGYDKSQTINLLALGRNPEQLRKSLGDTAIGNDPTRGDLSTSRGGIADELVKDLAGDWISNTIGSELTKILPLDVLRFQIGFGSVGVKAEKKAIENLRLIGEFEQTVRGRTGKVRAEVKFPYHVFSVSTQDSISLHGGWANQDFNDPAELDISDVQAKVVYRLFIP